MTVTTPCYRHPREVWMAACPECTAWHMAVELARRNQSVSVRATARRADRTPSPQAGFPPAGTHVPPAALHLAA